jgi:hypothetical protein
VLLNVVNHTPNQWVMLRSLGLIEDQIYRAQAHNIAYQDLCRGAIRDTRRRDIFNGIVIDRATALDIGGEFPGAILCAVPDAPTRRMPRRPGRKKNPDDTRTEKEKAKERSQRWAARQREAKQRAKDRRADG